MLTLELKCSVLHAGQKLRKIRHEIFYSNLVPTATIMKLDAFSHFSVRVEWDIAI